MEADAFTGDVVLDCALRSDHIIFLSSPQDIAMGMPTDRMLKAFNNQRGDGLHVEDLWYK
jgi:hypothetical protein